MFVVARTDDNFIYSGAPANMSVCVCVSLSVYGYSSRLSVFYCSRMLKQILFVAVLMNFQISCVCVRVRVCMFDRTSKLERYKNIYVESILDSA